MKRLELRNLGIIAHVDAGKTTVAEQMLVHAGMIRSAGRIDDGNTTMDHSPEERERGITIESAATRFDWEVDGKRFAVNFIDTPGHVDFTVEVERALRVLDGVVTVISGVSGVEPQTETVWRQADRYELPRLVFVNKLDLAGADFGRAIESVERAFDVVCVPLQRVTVDATGTIEILDRVADADPDLVEALADFDDVIAEHLLDDRPVSSRELTRAIVDATRRRDIVPVVGGSALKGVGIPQLLDLAVSILPPPARFESSIGTDDDAVAFVFKRTRDPYVGRFSWVRVYRGALRRGDSVVSSVSGKPVRVGRLVRILADQREEVDVLVAGDVGAIISADVTTGATLAAKGAEMELAPIVVADPVVWMKVEPARTADLAAMNAAVAELVADDPSKKLRVDAATGETVVGGQGELHLEVMASVLSREFGLDVVFGRPQVAYRETIPVGAQTTIRHRLKKQTGGAGMFAELEIAIARIDADDEVRVVDRTTGGSLPGEFVESVRRGIERAAEAGTVEAGYPIFGVEVTLLDAATHKTDSNGRAFERCAFEAFRLAVERAGVQRLQPFMSLHVTVPDVEFGSVLGELERRRGAVKEVRSERGLQFATVAAPLAETFGLTDRLRSVSKGKASHQAVFSHYG